MPKKISFSHYKNLLLPVLVLGFFSVAFFADASSSAFISQVAPPTTMTTGQTANVSVTMQNTGTDTWVQGGSNPYRLGSQNSQDNFRWGLSRVNLPVASVAPGASVTFNFTVTAPSTAGTHNYQWRMVHEGIAWFGAFTTNVSVIVNVAPIPCASPFPSNRFCGDYYQSALPPPSGAFTTFINKIPLDGNISTPFLNYNPFDATLGTNCGRTDNCAVRWQGNFSFNAASYTFSVTTDDGIRLYIDGVLRIDQWIDQCCPTYTYTQNMTAGAHLIKVEYYENAGGAEAVVGWTQNAAPDTTPPTPPTASLGSATQNSLTATWSGATDNVAVTGYRMDVSMVSNFGTFVSGYNNLDVGNVTSRLISGLSPSTIYYARVRAYDAAGNTSVNSNVPSLSTTAPPPPPNVSGYAWAGNGQDDGSSNNPDIGWIHMSGTAGSDTYGVSVSPASPGVLSGYALANPNDGATNNIGWITFNAAGTAPGSDLTGCPSLPCTATLDRTTGQISGWARAIVNGGGWDGWIRLRGTATNGNPYGITVSACNWSGYAWGGGTVIGWINFAGTNYNVTGNGDGCSSGGGGIAINATSDGNPWTGAVNFTLDGSGGPQVFTFLPTIPTPLPGVDGDYSLLNISGGPAGKWLGSITPSSMQTLSGGVITFTMNFISPPNSLAIDLVSLNTCGAISLTWNDVAGEDNYDLERDSGSGFVIIANPVDDGIGSTVEFDDTTIAQNTSYSYRVRAWNGFGPSGYSNIVSDSNESPSVNFTWAPSQPQVNQPTLFRGSATAYGGAAIDAWQWAFQDGNPASAATQNATTRFVDADPTSKNVSLEVTDSASRTCSVSQSVPIRTGSGIPIWVEEPPE